MTDYPHNDEAERTVLGACMLDSGAMAVASAMLTESRFFRPAHRKVWAAYHEIHERGESIDILSVRSELGDDGLKEVGGIGWLSGLTDGLPRITNLEQWCNLVLEAGYRRDLMRIGTRLTEQAANENVKVYELVDQAGQAINKVAGDSGGSIVKLADVIPQSIEQIEHFVLRRGQVGISTGWEAVDRSTGGGFVAGRLYFLAARSGRGKSALSMQWMAQAAKAGKKVLAFTTEMTPADIGERLLSYQAETDKWDIYRDESKWGLITRAVGEIRDWQIMIDRRESPTISQVRQTARKVAMRDGLDIVLIDHLQRLTIDSREGRYMGLVLAVQGAKNMAMALGVPVLVTSQLVSGDESKKPTTSDLAQCKQGIEAESDVIMFLHPESENWRDELDSKMMFWVDKARHGKCYSWTLGWEKPIHKMRMLGKA